MEGIKKILIVLLCIIFTGSLGGIWYFYTSLVEEQKQAALPVPVVAEPEPVPIDKIHLRVTEDIDVYKKEVENTDGASRKAMAELLLSDAYVMKGGKENVAEAAKLAQSVMKRDDIRTYVKARAIEALGTMICRTGVDLSLIPVVYTGEFKKYIKGTDRAATVRASRELGLLSYKTAENSRAAVTIARANMFIILFEKVSPEEKQKLAEEASQYLLLAKKTAAKEYAGGTDGAAEASYYFWTAVSYGQLAEMNLAYKEDADKAYAVLFAHLKKTGAYDYTGVSADIAGFAHLRYATYLKALFGEKRRADIERELTTVAKHTMEDPRRNISTVDRYFANRGKFYGQTKKADVSLNSVLALRGYSTIFDDFMDAHKIPLKV